MKDVDFEVITVTNTTKVRGVFSVFQKTHREASCIASVIASVPRLGSGSGAASGARVGSTVLVAEIGSKAGSACVPFVSPGSSGLGSMALSTT
jgi:hypothetical protein